MHNVKQNYKIKSMISKLEKSLANIIYLCRRGWLTMRLSTMRTLAVLKVVAGAGLPAGFPFASSCFVVSVSVNWSNSVSSIKESIFSVFFFSIICCIEKKKIEKACRKKSSTLGWIGRKSIDDKYKWVPYNNSYLAIKCKFWEDVPRNET